MKKRFTDPQTTIWDYFDEIDVVCPDCGSKGKVAKLSEVRDIFAPRRFTCLECGKNKNWVKSSISRPETEDPYFGFSLWYQMNCCGHNLFALNLEHLEFLESYVAAELRERGMEKEGWGVRNATMASRLPQWVKDKKNRREILRTISKMKPKCQQDASSNVANAPR